VEHWRTPYLGLREIPHGLDDFELTTFFSYSAHERRCIAERSQPLYRLAVALHIGFIRMTGRTLDAFERVPKKLWSHIAGQIDEDPPEIATLRSLYSKRPRTLADRQKLAYETLGFQQMTEHQRTTCGSTCERDSGLGGTSMPSSASAWRPRSFRWPRSSPRTSPPSATRRCVMATPRRPARWS
jgi:hypothetical protein